MLNFRQSRDALKLFPLLPAVMMILTGQLRSPQKIEWSDKSWTHNIFRLYEKIFWRKDGIRAEMSVHMKLSEQGKLTTTYYCHSFESVFSLAEQYIREMIGKVKFVKVRILKFAAVDGMKPSPFLFAIAYDNDVDFLSGSANPITSAFTCTGSNLALCCVNGNAKSQTWSSGSYASVSMADVDGNADSGNGSDRLTMCMMTGQATGSNTISIQWSSNSAGMESMAGSYSGVKQTGQPSAKQVSSSPANSLNFSMSVVTVDNNSWIVEGFSANTAPSNGTNMHIRLQAATYHGINLGDTNAAITPAGNTTMTVDSANSNTSWAGVQAVLSPNPPTSILTANGIVQASISSANEVAAANINTISGIKY